MQKSKFSLLVLLMGTLELFLVNSSFAQAIDQSPTPTPTPPPILTAQAPSFQHLYQNLFKPSCVGCHHNDPSLGLYGSPAAGIDLSSYEAMTLSNAHPENLRGHRAFLSPGNSAHSKLYTAVKSGLMPKEEGPTREAPIDPALISELQGWIDQGAQNN